MGNCFVSKPNSSKGDQKDEIRSFTKEKADHPQKIQNQNPENNKTDNQNKDLNIDDIQIKVDQPQDELQNEQNNNLQIQNNQNNEDQKSMNSDIYTEDEQGKKQRKEKQKKNPKMKVDYRDEAEIYENIEKEENKKLSQNDIDFIVKALGNHFVFNQLSSQNKIQVCQKMFYCKNTKDFIFKEGDEASSYFIIAKGECEVIINNEIRRKLKSGDAFGELALLYGAKRSASIKCVGQCYFYGIDRISFRKSIAEIVSNEYEENRQFIEKTKFFSMMTEQQKDNVTHVTISTMYQKKNHQVVCQGDQASSYFIIKKGKVHVQKNGNIIATMGPGDEFGEQALSEDCQRGATILTAEENVVLLSIGRDQIQKVLGNKVKQIIHNNLMKWVFEKNQLLSKLTKIQVEKVLNRSQISDKNENDVILAKNQQCHKLIFVLEGRLKRKDANKIIAEKGSCFGEEFLQQSKYKEVLKDSIIMDKKGAIGEISFKQFFEAIGGSLEQIITKNKDSHEKYMKKYDGSQAEKYISWKLDDLKCIKKLGFGQFGSVYLTKHKNIKKEYYALKVIQKSQVVEQNLEKHLLQEKKVLENVHFPFIMHFIRTFRDSQNVYFLVEYVKGMELFDVIREIGLLNTYDSQFYVGQMLLNMEYLHMQSIIYRDIKPENIMIDDKGYMKLIDMGTAKFLKGKGGRTFTIIGTPHYMAPEIINGKGYTYSVDLWSVGICLYEFMCGGVPFAEDADDPYEIYEEIMKKNSLQFPSFLKDKLARKLMEQLLSKIPEMRLGSSYAALKANQWFDNFDWDKLMKYTLKAPYIPPKDKITTSNELRKLEENASNVVDKVKKEHNQTGKNLISKNDPNWDKEF